MQRTRGCAPYNAGDTITLIHDDDNGLGARLVTVEAVIPLQGGRWRLEAHRDMAACPIVAVTVRADGYDDDGYVVPPAVAS